MLPWTAVLGAEVYRVWAYFVVGTLLLDLSQTLWPFNRVGECQCLRFLALNTRLQSSIVFHYRKKNTHKYVYKCWRQNLQNNESVKFSFGLPMFYIFSLTYTFSRLIWAVPYKLQIPMYLLGIRWLMAGEQRVCVRGPLRKLAYSHRHKTGIINLITIG